MPRRRRLYACARVLPDAEKLVPPCSRAAVNLLLPLRAVRETTERRRESHLTSLAMIVSPMAVRGDPVPPLYLIAAGQPCGSVIFPEPEWKTPV